MCEQILSMTNNLEFKMIVMGSWKYKWFVRGIQGSLNKFPHFFRMGTFIDSTHMKL